MDSDPKDSLGLSESLVDWSPLGDFGPYDREDTHLEAADLFKSSTLSLPRQRGIYAFKASSSESSKHNTHLIE